MRRYLTYFFYVIHHKVWVAYYCFRRGLIWQGIVHDWSKLLPSEFIPYSKHFYNSDGSPKYLRDTSGYYKPENTGDTLFEWSWIKHIHRNPHHPNHWCVPTEGGNLIVFEMPNKYVQELICDWQSAARVQGTRGVQYWWTKNKNKINLHEKTRAHIEEEVKKLS